MLMQARDEETGEGMSDQQLRDEVLTFLFAGYETTASALMWTWYALSQYPSVEKRLREELAAALDGRIPTFEDLRSLPYSRMVLEESMRLYPPGWGFERCAIGDDEIGGYHIPTGSLLFLCPYVTHRHPAFWDTPEEFDPERFTSERSAGRPRYAYFPFGGGPRQCIGNEFAMMECQLVVAMVAQRYRLHLVPGHPVEPDALAATLRTRHGILMTLQHA
jgi:cytochrome P450